MKKVILVRHGKSSWADPELEDHDRPLNKRGWRAAPVIAGWLEGRGHVAEVVLCSSSLRTRQTLERMREGSAALPGDAHFEAGLYHASPEAMFARLRALPEGCDSVMLIGHQPGLGAFARRLANGAVRPRCSRAFEHFPTAAAAVLELDIKDWAALEPHTARFVDFAKPRELMGER